MKNPVTPRNGAWTPEEALELLEAWRKSGLRLATFARDRGISRARLDAWRRRLGFPSARQKVGDWLEIPLEASSADPLNPPDAPAPAPPFAEIRLRPWSHTSRTAPAPAPITLRLPGGYRLEVPQDFDEQTLARLLGLMESRR